MDQVRFFVERSGTRTIIYFFENDTDRKFPVAKIKQTIRGKKKVQKYRLSLLEQKNFLLLLGENRESLTLIKTAAMRVYRSIAWTIPDWISCKAFMHYREGGWHFIEQPYYTWPPDFEFKKG